MKRIFFYLISITYLLTPLSHAQDSTLTLDRQQIERRMAALQQEWNAVVDSREQAIETLVHTTDIERWIQSVRVLKKSQTRFELLRGEIRSLQSVLNDTTLQIQKQKSEDRNQ